MMEWVSSSITTNFHAHWNSVSLQSEDTATSFKSEIVVLARQEGLETIFFDHYQSDSQNTFKQHYHYRDMVNAFISHINNSYSIH